MITKVNKVGSFTQTESKDYSDILDRELAREFLYSHKNYPNTKFGGTYELDLISGANSGCDVEFLSFNAIHAFKIAGAFRIPNRKEHYWSGSNLREGKNGKWNNIYQNWNVDYIQVFNDRNALVYYPASIVKTNINNKFRIDTQGWDEKNKWFIRIPFEDSKNIVEFYVRNEFGKWERQKI
jgi:hypothetical protein